MKKYRVLIASTFMTALALPFVSHAASITNPLSGNEDLITFVKTLIDAAIKLGAIVAVLAFIYAGFMFVTARGDEKKISTAKTMLLYTVIGMAILLGADAIANVIINTVEQVGSAAK